MRLSPRERQVIRQASAEVAGPDARVLLFGSRTQAELRGGDIDLLVDLPQVEPNRWALGIKLGARIEREWCFQNIDVSVADPVTPSSAELDATRRDGQPV
jgi:predicted nucleotidyltransferase